MYDVLNSLLYISDIYTIIVIRSYRIYYYTTSPCMFKGFIQFVKRMHTAQFWQHGSMYWIISAYKPRLSNHDWVPSTTLFQLMQYTALIEKRSFATLTSDWMHNKPTYRLYLAMCSLWVFECALFMIVNPVHL